MPAQGADEGGGASVESSFQGDCVIRGVGTATLGSCHFDTFESYRTLAAN
ncbi:MAG: hypothetical protein QNL88_12010 [Acidobacteriota bacterium]|nr:hypothetical protein [Acidobacteriota bacterium]